MTKLMEASSRRKYPWHEIDPQIFSGKISLAEIAEKYGIPYRQVTNRKYNLRDKIQRLSKKENDRDLKRFMKYLKIKDLSKVKMLPTVS